MNLQRTLGTAFLLYGILFGAFLFLRVAADPRRVQRERGNFLYLFLLEIPICFLATLGISDYLMNTLLIRHFRLTSSKKLPGTLVLAGLLPATVIAFFLLRVEHPVALSTLLPCAVSIVCGALFGSRIVRGLDGVRIRQVMVIALIGSLIALMIKIVLTRGAAGTATGLSLPKLILAVILAFFWGAVNMLGVPMKPAGTALFLLLGLSPLTTLTLVLVLACTSVIGGSIPMYRSGLYHQKLVCAASLGGSLGAVLGSLFAISLSATLLNILLLLVMLLAIFSLLRK